MNKVRIIKTTLLLIVVFGITIIIGWSIIRSRLRKVYQPFYYLKARDLIESGQKDEGIMLMKKYIRDVPEDYLGEFRLAQVYLDEGDYDAGEKYLLESLNKKWTEEKEGRIPVEKAIAFCELSYIYSVTGRRELSRKYIKIAKNINSAIGESLYLFGVANYEWGKIARSERLLRCLISVNEAKLIDVPSDKIENAMNLIEEMKAKQEPERQIR